VLGVNLRVFVLAVAASPVLIAIEFTLVLGQASYLSMVHESPFSDPALLRLDHAKLLLDLSVYISAVGLTFAVVYNGLGLDNLIRHVDGLRGHRNFEVGFAFVHAHAVVQGSMFQFVGGCLVV